MSNDYSLSDIQRALNEKKAKQSQQRQQLVESMAQQMPVKVVSEEDKRHQVVEQRLTALANRVDNLMGLSGRVSMVEETANTLVSGIGHNALGGSQGSGIVNISDADDANLEGIVQGDTLVWDASQNAFIPRTGGSGSGGGAGSLSDTLFIGNIADREILFEDEYGIRFNYTHEADKYGHIEWRTGTTSQGGIIKREIFRNNLDNAKAIRLDTKYDQDKDKGVYIEAKDTAGNKGGVTLHNFDAKYENYFDSNLDDRLVNIKMLNDRIDDEHAILIDRMIQMRNYADAQHVDGSMYTGNNTEFQFMNKMGFHKKTQSGEPILPDWKERFPVGSYVLMEKVGASDYGLFQVEVEGIDRGPTVEFNSIAFLDGDGEIKETDQVNIYAFNKAYDLTLLQLILHEIEAKVKKQGDTMTGGLRIDVADKNVNPISFEIKGIQNSGGGSNYIFASQLDSQGRDVCEYHGPVEGDYEVVNKQYIDGVLGSLAGGLSYIGNLDPNSNTVGDLKPNPVAGEFYIFTDDGTWEGETVHKNDYLLYDGTDWNVIVRDFTDDYLPLSGGTLTGNLTMGLGANFRMTKEGVIQTRFIDSAENTNLALKRDGDQKLLIGSEGIQVTGNVKVVGSGDFKLYNGCKFFSDDNEVMRFGGEGILYKGIIDNPQHLITKKYLDDKIGDVDFTGAYVPLDGSDPMTGNLRINHLTNNNAEAKLTLTGYKAGVDSVACVAFHNKKFDRESGANTGYLTYHASDVDKHFKLNQFTYFSKGINVGTDITTIDLYATGANSKIRKLDIDGTGNHSTVVFRVNGSAMFKSTDNINGNNIFEIYKDRVLYQGNVTQDNNVATKKYVDDAVGNSSVYAVAEPVSQLPGNPQSGALYKLGQNLYMGI